MHWHWKLIENLVDYLHSSANIILPASKVFIQSQINELLPQMLLWLNRKTTNTSNLY